jgi:hypothetical protein
VAAIAIRFLKKEDFAKGKVAQFKVGLNSSVDNDPHSTSTVLVHSDLTSCRAVNASG